MGTQRISIKHQRTLSDIGLLLLLGCALLTSDVQAAVPVSDSLLPPTTTDMLQQSVQQPSALANQKQNKALTQSEIIDQATSQSADAHLITKNKDGSVRIPSPMQDVVATLTSKGASFQSVDNAKGDFALYVNGLGREKDKLTKINPGKISSDEKIARLFRNNLIEEFTTSSGGIRQDFVVPQSPKGKGKLVLELDLKGATAALDDQGAMLTLEGGRKLAYHSLMVADASGQTLPAHFALHDSTKLRIIVDDKSAQYPVRIDPTITDADWFSLGATVPSLNGTVLTMVSDGAGNLYIGGAFSSIAGIANTKYIAKWNGNSWSALGSGMNNTVYALAWSGSNLYAGGSFSSAGGVSASKIAKWDGSAWSTLGSGMNSTVYALVWNGSYLYSAGHFTSIGGIIANHIAKWDGSAWSTLGSGMNSFINTLAWDGTNLYAGGNFTSAGEIIANRVARWDGSAWNALGSGINANVLALAWDGSSLYAGGSFTGAGGITANHVARWDGSIWSALGSGISTSVNALIWNGTHLYAGPESSNASGVATSYVVSWDGRNWNTLGLGLNGPVKTLAWDGSNLYAGGSFFSAGGAANTLRIAKWNTNNWSSLSSGKATFSNPPLTTLTKVNALAWDGSNLYAGGQFTYVGNQTANHIAKWNGSVWSTIGSGMDNPVCALSWDGTNLYAGGSFTSAGDITANRIAQWDGSSWSPLGSGMDKGTGSNAVWELLWDGSNLYAGGLFTTADGITANNIAKWNGNSWNALGSGMDGPVGALAWDGSNLYAGGRFSSAGGITANRIARWDGTTWSALGSGMQYPGFYEDIATVYALIWDGANLIAGGKFISPSYHIAKWDGSAWSALDSGVNSNVYALAWDGANLYAGGDFTNAARFYYIDEFGQMADFGGGVTVNHIAKWDGNVWIALGSGTNSAVYSITLGGADLYASGSFSIAGNKNAGYVAGIDLDLTTPHPLLFVDLSNVSLDSLVSSETLNIGGLANANLSIINGEYSLNGGAFTSAPGTVSNSDSLQLRSSSSANYNTTTNVIVSVKNASYTWSATTLADNVPDAFTFTDQTNIALSTQIISDTVTITGLAASSPVSVTGGEYSINNGNYSSAPRFINNNDSITLKTTSAVTESTPTDVILNIGGITDTFTVTTEADTDGDTIVDSADNCPTISNVSQTNTDGDTQGNACDADDDNDGISDLQEITLGTNPLLTDTDADGVNDKTDAFPTNNAASVDENNNGKPDEWNATCDTDCQNNSGLTLDGSGGDSDSGGGGGSTHPLLLGLLSLFILSIRRRVKL